MTPQQRKLLDYIKDFMATRRFSPSFEEMQTYMGLASKSGVDRLVKGLVERGYLTKESAIRGLRVVDRGSGLKSDIARLRAQYGDQAVFDEALTQVAVARAAEVGRQVGG